MRKRLGGRVSPEPALVMAEGTVPVGAIVSISQTGGAARVGILLSVSEDVADVYVADGIVKRTRRDLVALHRGPLPSTLALVAESATVFGRLAEEQPVEVERSPGHLVAGKLIEKCRYGALVRLKDGTVLGVGFRKMWPERAPTAFAN
jgi:hypothetical protein